MSKRLFPQIHAWEAIRSGLVEILAHKLRSFLTLLGTILGTLSLVVMISVIIGAGDMVRQFFAELGFDGMIEVMSLPGETEQERIQFAGAPPLSIEDVRMLRQHVPDLLGLAPVQEMPVTGNILGKQITLQVRGTSPEYLRVRKWKLKSGRNLTETDLERSARVAVISEEFSTEYFPNQSPLGRQLRVNNVRLIIVGVIKKLEGRFYTEHSPWSQGQMVTIPITTMRKFLRPTDAVDQISILIRDVQALDFASAAVNRNLELAHRGVMNFKIRDIGARVADAEEQYKKQSRTWNVILGALASVALLVGGIGILSVMLIAIRERIYEIGLRKAIGATNLEVFLQFILESLVLSGVGALAGITLGLIVVLLVSQYFPFPLSPAPSSVGLAFGFALLTGLLFGWYPAQKASRMEPVEALRA